MLRLPLGRRMEVAEAAALHADIDLMLQRSVIASVDEQKATLRAAAETELKFLSFLAHDINNNLNNVNILLAEHAMDLAVLNGADAAVESLGRAQKSILDTVAGMRGMLEHERLRKSNKRPTQSPVDLHTVATMVAWQFARAAGAKGIKISVETHPHTVVESNSELITVVLQNLVGNAVKYSSSGTVRIGSDLGTGLSAAANARGRRLWVSDDGAGIAPEKLGDIFEAFRRGEVHGQWGVGLGLAIASQGAKLLGAELTVESKVGIGSTFLMIFPARAGDKVVHEAVANPAT